MAKLSHRVFAATMAGVFFLSAVAFSVFVVYDMVQSRKNQAEVQSATDAQAAQQAACPPTSEAEVLPAPEAYTTSEDVTELQITDLEAGNGQAVKAGDCVVVKYYGSLASNGEMFDENFTKPTDFGVQIGQGMVIEGWDKGLIGMQVGATRRLVIPSEQAYGPQSQAKIPANSDLVFVVKLLEIKKP